MARCKERDLKVHQGPTAQQPLGKQDVVIVLDVIERLPDPAATMKAVWESLQPATRASVPKHLGSRRKSTRAESLEVASVSIQEVDQNREVMAALSRMHDQGSPSEEGT